MASEPVLIYGARPALQPLVSIVIPTFRRPRWLREALASALGQIDAPPHEVLAIDNAQSGENREVVAEFPAGRVALYQNPENLGMWGSMNTGLRLARGEWVLILCDDDLLLPDALQRFARVLKTGGAEPIGCLAGVTELLIEPDVNVILRPRAVQHPFAPPAGAGDRAFPVTDTTPIRHVPKLCSSFFARERALARGGWDAACHGFADVALYLDLQRRGALFGCRERFGRFRVHAGGGSRQERIWREYPVAAAAELLRHTDPRSEMGAGVRRMIEATYLSALWKTALSPAERRRLAGDLLDVVKARRRRVLMRHVWLLDAAAALYRKGRPHLGRT